MEFIDLKAQYQYLKSEIDGQIQQVLNSTHFILGETEKEFEQKLAEYVGVKHCIGCGNGTEALQLIYMAYGIGAGDAVFCPDMTFIASIEPAMMLGAYPVLCDIDPISYNIDPDSLVRQIEATIEDGRYTPKAIVAVDFIGNPADYSRLTQIAKKYDLLLIEDAAQGMGASINGKKCGSFGDIAATSFFPSKPLGCYGDGGAIFTNDDEISELIRSLRVHGKGIDKYHNVRVGLNSRLDSIQAAIMLPKLAVLDEEISKRQQIAKIYNDAFENRYQIPHIESGNISSYAQYALLAENEKERDECISKLKENDIPSLVYYPVPLHMMEVFKYFKMGNEDYKNTIDYADRTFSLPFSAYLMKCDQEKVCRIINN